jgi:hypothetical protein
MFGNFLIYRVNFGKRDVGGIPARLVDLTDWATYTGLICGTVRSQ